MYDHGKIASVTEKLISAVFTKETSGRPTPIEKKQTFSVVCFGLLDFFYQFIRDEWCGASSVVEVDNGIHGEYGLMVDVF